MKIKILLMGYLYIKFIILLVCNEYLCLIKQRRNDLLFKVFFLLIIVVWYLSLLFYLKLLILGR